jgi:alanine racemase
VVVDLDSIRHNVALLAGRAAVSGAATMAVVKADGYGHGAVPVARAALEAGSTWLGVASVAEALELREAGITAEILSWLNLPSDDLADAVTRDIQLGVSSRTALEQARRAGPAKIHLKIDTGLSRNGCPAADWPDLVHATAKAEAAGDVTCVAVWSHLASADLPGDPSIDAQAARFDEAYAIARDAGLHPLRHLANSAATLSRPDLHFDLVRVGIALYGLNPLPTPEDLRPAMTFQSSVALVKRISAGEAVSYGGTWTADRDTTVALVPVGYGDGVPRALSGRMDVLLDGRRRPIRGRVCMDQIIVDCGDDPVREGTPVTLFGASTQGPTAREWADTIGTIDYEIVTGMHRPRIHRTYLGLR